ncbi:MAG: 2-oxoglutarate dehydrogenase, E2 component, dihydrolipoamide succinyltransferase [Ignavibacteriae bacterium]|nr:2-oxoglutarate dehydrogenase, E2 component, dihydrolipoamide succinyltransferase [Ignavibacteriota bacterium]
MATDILMPKMGESVQEGTILRWMKQPGDKIERDEIIAEISTDKVDTEIPSSEEGVLLEILANEGDTVEVGAVIARLGAEGEVASGGGSGSGGGATASSAPAETAAPVAAAEAQPTTGTSETPVVEEVAAKAEPASNSGADAGERNEVLMPKMGESVQEGTILRWLKQPGDQIERDEIIAEISTDKVDTEIPSSFEGKLLEIVAAEGETVEVGKVIAYIGSGAVGGSAPAPKNEAPAPQAAAAPAEQPKTAPPAPQSPPTAAAVVSASSHTNGGPVPRESNGRFYSPLVRTIAQQEGVSVAELDALHGSGAGGRVTKNDLTNYIQSRGTQPVVAQPTPTQPAIAQPKAAPAITAAPTKKVYGDDVEVVPMDRMRQLIAEHMVRSKATSPHVTEVGEADVSGLVRLREGQKKAFEDREGIKLTYTPFFVAAIARALRENPWVNGAVDGTNVIVNKHVNVGVATALPDGNLIVPVVKDADRMNVTGLAHTVYDLANRARNKQLSPDDIAGGTFTLTNYGVFNLLHGAPIINQPQVAILGSGAIQKRPVVREIDGQDMIVIRSMIYLSLSHDHRIIDGLLGGKFLSDVIKNLESFNENTML